MDHGILAMPNSGDVAETLRIDNAPPLF